MNQFERFHRYLNQLLAGQDHRRIENGSYMPLSIERITPNQISLCHYGEQNGDLMRDPEMVFELIEMQPGQFVADPIYFRNDYAGIEQVAKWEEDGKTLCRPALQQDLRSFARQWFRNIKEQGFFEV